MYLWVGFIICPRQQHDPGPRKARKVVNVPVCVVITIQSFGQPHNRSHPQPGPQPPLNVGAPKPRIPIRVQQAFGCGQKRALAVHVYAAPLQDDGASYSRQAGEVEYTARHGIVPVKCRVQSAVYPSPRIELPSNARNLA
jgi:hypothetical protein